MQTWKFNHNLRRIRTGDIGGLEAIYNEYYEKAVFTVLPIVCGLEQARDVASDFILAVYQKAKDGILTKVNNADYWMYASARNRAIDFIRKEARMVSGFDEQYDGYAPEHDAELYLDLAHIVKKLPEDKRELFMLHYIYGFKYSELSELTGKSEGAIKAAILRIKEIIKDYLK